MGAADLQDVGQMMDELSDVRQVPQGMLRIISSFGFGRQVVAPALSALAKAYPQLELRLMWKTGWSIWSMKVLISIFALAMTSPLI